MRFLLPIIFILTAFLLGIGVMQPLYQNVKELRVEEARYDDALSRTEELRQVREQLLTTYNNFSTNDLNWLNKLLPDTVDNVRLVLDLDSIARGHNMFIRDILFDRASRDSSSSQQSGTAVVVPSSQNSVNEITYDSLVISFSVDSSYENLVSFISDIERSLRLVDVVSINTSSNGSGSLQHRLSLRIYWLK